MNCWKNHQCGTVLNRMKGYEAKFNVKPVVNDEECFYKWPIRKLNDFLHFVPTIEVVAFWRFERIAEVQTEKNHTVLLKSLHNFGCKKKLPVIRYLIILFMWSDKHTVPKSRFMWESCEILFFFFVCNIEIIEPMNWRKWIVLVCEIKSNYHFIIGLRCQTIDMENTHQSIKNRTKQMKLQM